MIKLSKPTVFAAMLVASATYAFAQAQNPNADPRPLPPTAGDNQPYDKKTEPTNPAAPPAAGSSQGVGSRGMGEPAESRPETPADKNTTDLKKLDKQGRGGQQN